MYWLRIFWVSTPGISNLLSTPLTNLSDSSFNYDKKYKYEIALIHTLFQRKYSPQTFRKIQYNIQHMIGAMFCTEEVHIIINIVYFVV